MLPIVPVSEPLPLDAMPNASAAYSLSRIVGSSYSGPLFKVRRDSDDTTLACDTIAEAEAFCAATDGFIDTLYDQSGNAANLTQATLASQPQIIASGVAFRDGERVFAVADNGQNLSGTLAESHAANNTTVVAIVKDSTASYDAERHDFLAVRSGTSPCLKLLLGSQGLFTISYATPGGTSTQSGDIPDRPMSWSRFQMLSATCAATITLWRNDYSIGSLVPANTGASGTNLWFGSTTGYSLSFSELYLFAEVLDIAQIGTLYRSINAFHIVGPIRQMPTVALQERHPWETVLRRWMADLTDDDLTVTIPPAPAFTWDDTYANTDELLRIYLHSVGGFSNQNYYTEGLIVDPKWWRLIAVNEIGIESDFPLYSQNVRSPGIIRQFAVTQYGSQSAYWANWYIWNLPKSGDAQGNPFYGQRGVAVRALIDSIVSVMQIGKEADINSYSESLDQFGGTVNMAAWTFKHCRGEMPLHVQQAFLQMLRYAAHRCAYKPPRYVNANMDCKGIQALATIYTVVPDAASKQECIDGVKRALFGSPTGTADGDTTLGLYDNAGHIKEGTPGNGSPETTYNGHSLYHLIGALSHVRGDSNWDFFATVIDRLARFKFAQYFVQPDGSHDGPGGYGGRTGGCRVQDQGFEAETEIGIGSFSTYGRPGNTSLPDTSGIISLINAQLTTLNTNVDISLTIHGSGTGLHTDGVDCFQRECTVQYDPANTLTSAGHGIPNGTLVAIAPQSGSTMPTGAAAGLYYIINATANTMQISSTEGGSAISLTETADPSDTVGPLLVRPVAYLTDNPDLNYSVFSSCEPFVIATVDSVEYAGQIVYKDNTLKVVAIWGHLQVPAAIPVAYEIVNGPKRWLAGRQLWSVQGPYFPDVGYYDAQRTRISGDDDTLKTPWEKPADFNDWYNDDWWLYKSTNASSREYGWMVECLDVTGAYDGWYGGKVEEFWTRDGGTVIRCRHDKSGTDPNQGENTRVWSEVDQWATMHVWGKDASGKAFSSAVSKNTTFSRTLDKVGPPISANVSATNIATWLESGTAITGTFAVDNTFETTTGGLTVTQAVTHTGTDNITDLWATIPVYLRNASQGGLTDTTIQYWTGGAWIPLTTEGVSTEAIRLGRNHGSGTKYVWITFPVPENVRLSSVVWVESEYGDGRYRNIKLDLLGYTGASQSWPASSSITYTITSVDPGYTATEPSISITYPATGLVLPVDGRWMVKGDVEWLAATGTVTAEYTTNGSTWNSIGSMTNTTGNTWEFTGGTIPSSVVGVRMRATPPTGSEGAVSVNVTSATYTLAVEDNFTAADDTSVNASYTSWTTNTTGNAYQILNSTSVDVVRVASNAAGHNEAASTISARTIGIDIAGTDSVVEGVLKIGTANTQGLPGISSRVVSGHSNGNRCCCGITNNFAFEFRPSFNSGFTPELYLAIPSFDANTPYRMVLQTVGDAACASVYDGETLVGTLYKFGMFNTSNTRVGFTAPALAASAYFDTFKVYTP